MARIKWDQPGEHKFETGISNVVLFVAADAEEESAVNGYREGVAWSGVTGVSETPSGGDETKLYADNIKYLSLRSAEDYGATITAYTYPDEWEECDGSARPVAGMSVSQQPRRGFCLAFFTLVGNDTKGTDYGEKLHILYGCTTSPSEKTNQTVNESPEANEFSWEVSTTPVETKIDDLKPTARITVDSTSIEPSRSKAVMDALKDALWGKDGGSGSDSKSHILLPQEVYEIIKSTSASG